MKLRKRTSFDLTLNVMSIVLLIHLFVVGCWIVNAIKFINCDFEAPYKQEIIHAAGLIPYISVITVWYE